ncbi:hypothetical protein [Thermococcus sp. Bubb.Bath]|nr:hypothetical protein [Thermococcus sp. Bubb.Bath]
MEEMVLTDPSETCLKTLILLTLGGYRITGCRNGQQAIELKT